MFQLNWCGLHMYMCIVQLKRGVRWGVLYPLDTGLEGDGASNSTNIGSRPGTIVMAESLEWRVLLCMSTALLFSVKQAGMSAFTAKRELLF